jgi:hypothetical protein
MISAFQKHHHHIVKSDFHIAICTGYFQFWVNEAAIALTKKVGPGRQTNCKNASLDKKSWEKTQQYKWRKKYIKWYYGKHEQPLA